MLKVLATPERLTFGLKQMVAYEHAHGVTAYNKPGALVTPEIWKFYLQILGASKVPMYAAFLADGRGIVDHVSLDGALDAVEQIVALAPPESGRKLMFLPIYLANAKFSVSSPTGYFKVFRQQGAQVVLVLARVTEEVCAGFAKPVK